MFFFLPRRKIYKKGILPKKQKKFNITKLLENKFNYKKRRKKYELSKIHSFKKLK